MPLIQRQNQVRKEIKLATVSIFWMSFPTVALFFWEVKGYSKLYDNISESSLGETTDPDQVQLKIVVSHLLKTVKSK